MSIERMELVGGIMKALNSMGTNERMYQRVFKELQETSMNDIETVMKDFKVEEDCVKYIGTCKLFNSESENNVSLQLLDELTLINEQ